MVELRLKDVLQDFVHGRGFEERLGIYRAYGRWEEIVGPEVARHVRPVHVRRGELHVVADSGVWASEFSFATPTVLARLRDGGAQVKEIHVRQGTLPQPEAVPGLGEAPKIPPPPPQQAAELIRDPELRERFARLAHAVRKEEDPPAPAHRR